ncbi:hypothetical protein MMUR_55710 [Mycolicibacterium murale]|jgi:hypothetical protein|uniref:Transposase n=1 Tax=Mycolicibacterium murale TaxID=182220 RepID=A0A7I9WUQ8_9MYCO|nr:hypothetical protein MMUR_55710 [Mycolicibacterium murale]
MRTWIEAVGSITDEATSNPYESRVGKGGKKRMWPDDDGLPVFAAAVWAGLPNPIVLRDLW